MLPDLNPIDHVFAKLKTLLRKTDPRTVEQTWRDIGALLDRFTAEECANYPFRRESLFSIPPAGIVL